MATKPGMSYAPDWYQKQEAFKTAINQFSPQAKSPSSSTSYVMAPGAAPVTSSTGHTFTAPSKVVNKAPTVRQQAPTTSGGGGGGNGYSAGATLGTNAQGQAAEVAQPMSDEDWWNSDADFQVENAGLQNVLQTALANLATKRSNYDTDFVGTLKNLGWDWNGDDAGSLDEVGGGKWDPTNKLGSYGSGLGGLNNDFASRGLIDSSFYGDALTNFNTDFNNQFGNLTKQRGSFQNENGDNTGQGLAARNEYQNALARARQSSLARRDVTP